MGKREEVSAMNNTLKWSKLYLFFVFILLYVPIFYLIYFSFNEGGTMNDFTGFTFEHYSNVLQDQRLIQIVINTLLIALISSIIATIIGTFGAIGIYSVKNQQVKKSLLGANNILLVSPDVIIGSSFLLLFTIIGYQLGFMSVLLSHIAFSIPIVVLMVLPSLEALNESMIKAAEDLGANRWQVLSQVILPNIVPGIFAGFFMAFTYSLDDFAVTFFVTGNGFTTLSVEIYSRARQGISLEINALSTLLFIASLLLVLGYYFISKYNQRVQRVEKVVAR